MTWFQQLDTPSCSWANDMVPTPRHSVRLTQQQTTVTIMCLMLFCERQSSSSELHVVYLTTCVCWLRVKFVIDRRWWVSDYEVYQQYRKWTNTCSQLVPEHSTLQKRKVDWGWKCERKHTWILKMQLSVQYTAGLAIVAQGSVSATSCYTRSLSL
jgi:hypothetical protein